MDLKAALMHEWTADYRDDYTLFFPETPPAPGRVVGVATCCKCRWQAAMTGDTNDEVDQFLSALFRDHVVDEHTRPQ